MAEDNKSSKLAMLARLLGPGVKVDHLKSKGSEKNIGQKWALSITARNVSHYLDQSTTI